MEESMVNSAINTLPIQAVKQDMKNGHSWFILGNAYMALFFGFSLDPANLQQVVACGVCGMDGGLNRRQHLGHHGVRQGCGGRGGVRHQRRFASQSRHRETEGEFGSTLC